MKRVAVITILTLSLLSCKKSGLSPEGPTDIRIRNISSYNYHNVILSTSEYKDDTDTIGDVTASSESGYFRFKKAYPKAVISADINLNNSFVRFSTGTVDYAFMQYIGRDKMTYEITVSDTSLRKLEIKNLILDEALEIK